MTDRQNNKMNMHITTFDLCQSNRNVWEDIPAFVRYVNELEGRIQNAKYIVQNQQGVVVKGITVQKGSAEDILIQECLAVGGALYAYGFDTGNAVLMETGQVNKHALYHTHGQLTPAKARNIAEVAATHAEKLLDYAIGEAEHLALSLAIAGYEALLLSPREAINERKQYTGSPAPAATDSLLCDRMDRIAARFKNSRSEFYNGYKDARAVKGGHSGKRPAAGTPSGTK